MSERKTAEIKFRIKPTEKAAWQAYAGSAGLALSELIRREVNAGIEQSWAKQNAALDGTRLLDNAIAKLREQGAGKSGAVAELCDRALHDQCDCEAGCGATQPEMLDPDDSQFKTLLFASPDTIEQVHSWTFEGRRG